MNKLDLDYQNLLKDILENGTIKQTRNGSTISVFGRQICHKMSEGFPLLTTKKMHWKSIVTELLWFLRGDTNIKYLVDNDCHIWDGDAYKAYVKYWEPNIEYIDGKAILTQEEFINKIKTDDEFAKKWGDLGPVYGKQWRGWIQNVSRDLDRQIDQITNLIRDLKTNPDSRRLMVNAWNVGELDQMVLPPCHYGFQVYTRELSEEERMKLAGYEDVGGIGQNIIRETVDMDNTIPRRAISLMWNQRSVDTFLGLPFNIASYGLLLEIIAKEVNMVPDELIGNLGDVHLYNNHIEQAKEQIGRELTIEERIKLNGFVNETEILNLLPTNMGYIKNKLDENNTPTRTREPYPLPKLWINDLRSDTNSIINDITKWSHEDFKLEDYQSHPTIKAPLSN